MGTPEGRGRRMRCAETRPPSPGGHRASGTGSRHRQGTPHSRAAAADRVGRVGGAVGTVVAARLCASHLAALGGPAQGGPTVPPTHLEVL
ncbi:MULTISPECIES: hypothetical protein [Streptomyces]|uniref:hypothetical protein n=1 Tax=Streptomyces TaxID=1883 RepID=UPI002FDBFD2B